MNTMTKEDLGQLAEEIKQLQKSIEQNAMNLSERVIQRAEKAFSDLSQKVSEKTVPVIDSVKVTGKRVDDYVKKSPWQSAGAALIVGLLFGMLLRNRK